jgi:hypothetical protein
MLPTFLILKTKAGLWDHLATCVSPPEQAGALESEENAVTRQRLGKHFPAATNTHATVEELLDAVFSMWSLSFQVLNM